MQRSCGPAIAGVVDGPAWNIAGVFAGFANAFVVGRHAKTDVALAKRLDRAALDYSRASLASVDASLEASAWL